MKRGDKVKVPGFVLSVADGIATIEFNGTWPENGQRIRIATVAIDPEDVTDTAAAIRDLATRPFRMNLTDEQLEAAGLMVEVDARSGRVVGVVEPGGSGGGHPLQRADPDWAWGSSEEEGERR